MVEILTGVRDMLMASIMSWLGVGADISGDLDKTLMPSNLSLMEISDTVCPESSLDKAMEDASGA